MSNPHSKLISPPYFRRTPTTVPGTATAVRTTPTSPTSVTTVIAATETIATVTSPTGMPTTTTTTTVKCVTHPSHSSSVSSCPDSPIRRVSSSLKNSAMDFASRFFNKCKAATLTVDGATYTIVASTPENLSKRDEPTGISIGSSSSGIGIGTAISGATTSAGNTITSTDTASSERLKTSSPTGGAAGIVCGTNTNAAGATGVCLTTAEANIIGTTNAAAAINGQVARHGSLTIVRRSNSRKNFTQVADSQQTSTATTPSASSTNPTTISTSQQPTIPQTSTAAGGASTASTALGLQQFLTTPLLEEYSTASSSSTPTTTTNTTTNLNQTASTPTTTIPYDNRSKPIKSETIKTFENNNNSQAIFARDTINQPLQTAKGINSNKINNTNTNTAITSTMQPTSPNATNFRPASICERGSPESSNDSLHDPSSVPQSQVDLATENLPAVDTPDACDKAALRLRHLLRLLNNGEVSGEVLRKNLHYAARVLEAVFIDESKDPSKPNQGRSSSVDDEDPGDGANSKERCNGNCKNLNCSHEQHSCISSSSAGGTIAAGDDGAPATTATTNQDNNNTNSSCSLEQQQQHDNQSNIATDNQTSIDSRTKGVTLTPQAPTGWPTGPPQTDGEKGGGGGGDGEEATPETTATTDTTKSAETNATDNTDTAKNNTTSTADSSSSQNVGNSSSSSNKATIQRQRRLRTPVWARSMSTNKTRLADEDDELSEVQPDAVPPEVREWLASTFTRQLATTRRRTDEKPKFRSVAHAIRAGIFVDRIYRRVSSTALMQFPPEVVKVLKTLDDWSFDVFALADAANGQPVKYIGYDLLNRYGIIHKFKIAPATLEAFLHRVEEGYCRYRNPYHNNLHAADVTQTVHHMLCQTGLMNWLTDLEIFATLLAALIHDYEHTGTTNNFHVMSGSETALLYNDRAVLENHHISAAFRLLKDDDCNVLSNLSREEYRELRTLIIDMVLSTDMSFHFQQLKNMKNLLTLNDPAVDKSKALALVLHCCDISHPAKRWNLHHRWTMLLLEEFFRQGDLERELGLPFSPLCDRNNTLVAESQIGFIDFIVDPSMSVMADMLEYVLLPIAPMCKNVNASIDAGDVPVDGAAGTSTARGITGSSCTTIRESCEEQSTPAPSKCLSTDDAGKLKFTIRKPWVLCLTENKKIWKEQAVKDAEARAAAAALEEAKTKETESEDV